MRLKCNAGGDIAVLLEMALLPIAPPIAVIRAMYDALSEDQNR
jgi:hypothetical protein